MNMLDLFSGIGGFSLAAQRAGFKIEKHYASEVDKYAKWIYRYQFPESIQLGDITKIGNEHGKIDIITGGFPCQSFSIAGKRKGFDDTRGTLFFEIKRLAGFYKPKYMVLENVKGLLNHDRGNTIRVILDELRRLNYAVQLMVLNTVDAGIPQNRERCFFICTAAGERQPEISHIREAKRKNTFSANCIDANYWKGIDNHGQRTCVQAVMTPDIAVKHQNGRIIKDNDEPMFTLTARDKHGVLLFDDLSRGIKENTSGNAPTLRAQSHGNLPTISIQRCFSKQYSTKIEETGTLQASRIDKVPTVLLSDSGQSRKRELRNIAPPLRAHDGCGHDNYAINNTIIRRLTPTECERLQDYPDDWTKYGINETGEQVEISDTQRYKTLGNSITVKVAEEIFKAIGRVYDR